MRKFFVLIILLICLGLTGAWFGSPIGGGTGVGTVSEIVALFTGEGDYLKSDGTRGTPVGTDVTFDESATAGGLTLEGQEVSFQEASRSTAGYLSAAYFGQFADAEGVPVTLHSSATTAGLSITGQEVSYRAATTDQNGYLTSNDWNTFNNKQSAQNEVTLNSSASLGGLSIADQEISAQESSRSQAGYLSAAYFQDFADKEDSNSDNINPDRLLGDNTPDNKVDHSIILPPGTSGQLIYNNAGALAGMSTIGLAFANGTTSNADAVGEPYFDTNADNSVFTTPVFIIHDGSTPQYFFPIDAINPTNGQVQAYNSTSKKMAWADPGTPADDSITAAKMANGDHGAFTYVSNVAALDANSVDSGHLATSTPGITTKSTATDYTIGTTDAKEAYGGVIYVTGAATITAPAIAARMAFTVITIGATAVSVDVNSSDRMYLDGTALADGDKATNTSTTGDMIVCTYESASGWYCASGSPDGDHWTDGN